jgi:hypothetical protein
MSIETFSEESILIYSFAIYFYDAFSVMSEESLNMSFGMKTTDFWDTARRSLMEVDRHFRGTYCLYHQVSSIIETVRTFETSAYFH